MDKFEKRQFATFFKKSQIGTCWEYVFEDFGYLSSTFLKVHKTA